MALVRTELVPIVGSLGLIGPETANGAEAIAPPARRAVLDALLDRYEAPLYDYVFRLSGSAAGAAQLARLTQDALVEVARRPLPGGAGERQTAVRLFAAATSRCRAAQRRVRFGLVFRRDDSRGRPDACAVLDSLSPDERACVLLREHHSFTYDEIAEVLGTTRSAVAAHLSAAREAIIRPRA